MVLELQAGRDQEKKRAEELQVESTRTSNHTFSLDWGRDGLVV